MQKNVIRLKAISFNLATLHLFYLFLKNIFIKYNFHFESTFLKKKKKITLLKSPHVHKKAREQFEMSKFSFISNFSIPKSKTAEFFFFLKLNTPKNIDINFKLSSDINLFYKN